MKIIFLKKTICLAAACVRAKAELFWGWRFSASPKKREPETDPQGARPKKLYFFSAQKKTTPIGAVFKKNQKIKFISWIHLLLSVCRPLRVLHLHDRLGLGFLAILESICEPFVRHWFVDNIC